MYIYQGKHRERKPPGPTARARKRRSRNVSALETANKKIARDRDGRCRFPFCGCRSRGLGMKGVLTVSHDRHKGIGGDPTGDRSQPELLILLCKWRHQDAPVSRHAGTMRTRYLTDAKNDGPVAFDVDLWAVYPGLYMSSGVWLEVAREIERGVLGALNAEQCQVLDDLAGMDR